MSQSSNTPPSRSTRLPWVIAVLALVALAVVLVRQESTNSEATRDAELVELQQRLDALEQGSGSGLRRQGQGASLGNVAGRSGTDGRSASERLSALSGRPNLTPEQQQAQRERQQRQLQAEFEADARDPAAGAKIGRHLEDTVVGKDMAATGLVPEDVSVQCRRTLCRVAADFANPGDAEDWAIMYLTSAGGAISRARTVRVRQPDGSTQVIIYGTRGEGR